MCVCVAYDSFILRSPSFPLSFSFSTGSSSDFLP